MIQETRRYILDILKKQGDSTVDEIVTTLHQLTNKQVTAATVRHHLDILQKNGLVSTPKVRRRDTPGRPQYIYHLTDKARDYFPANYVSLASSLIEQIASSLPETEANVIFEGAATRMAVDAEVPDAPMQERLDYIVDYLNEQGYQASWETASEREGFILRTSNCPFEQLSGKHDEVCHIDMHLISNLLGVVPRRLGRLVEGEHSCTYFIPVSMQSPVANQ